MKVYLSEYIAPAARQRLADHCEIIDNFDHPEELDAIIVRRVHVSKNIIDKATKLKCISMHGVGLDTIDVAEAKAKGIPVVNVPGASAESVAELAVTLLLAVSRKIKYIDAGLQHGLFHHFGQWDTVGHEVFGKTLGLVGSGHIACKTAAIMKAAFQTQLLCYNPLETAATLKAKGFTPVPALQDLFAASDFVSIHVPLTPETEGMIDADVLHSARPGLILVNTARGGIVDEKALYEALKSHRLGGAGLDVFADEVPSPQNPLLQLDNFIGTLHIGGSTTEALERVSQAAVDHVLTALDA